MNVPSRRVQVGVMVGVAFVVLAVFGVLVGRGSESTDGPKPLVDKDKAEVVDEFERANGPGLRPDKKARWTTTAGVWRIQNKAAAVTPPKGRRAMAVVGTEGADGTVQVAMSQVANGAGIVFRYKDALNYWSFTAAPAFATWSIERVTDGKPANIGNTGLSPVKPGTVATVRLKGDVMQFLINGRQMKEIKDPAFQEATRVGLIARSPAAARARWDRFLADMVKGTGTQPAPTTRPAPGATTVPPATTTTARPPAATTSTTARR